MIGGNRRKLLQTVDDSFNELYETKQNKVWCSDTEPDSSDVEDGDIWFGINPYEKKNSGYIEFTETASIPVNYYVNFHLDKPFIINSSDNKYYIKTSVPYYSYDNGLWVDGEMYDSSNKYIYDYTGISSSLFSIGEFKITISDGKNSVSFCSFISNDCVFLRAGDVLGPYDSKACVFPQINNCLDILNNWSANKTQLNINIYCGEYIKNDIIYGGQHGPIPDENNEVSLNSYFTKYFIYNNITKRIWYNYIYYLNEIIKEYNIIDINSLFSSRNPRTDYVYNISEVNLNGIDLNKLKSKTLLNIFANQVKIEELDISNWDFSSITNIRYFCYNCQSLEKINGVIDCSSLTTVNAAFSGCPSTLKVHVINKPSNLTYQSFGLTSEDQLVEDDK